jgi:hypothetical protein
LVFDILKHLLKYAIFLLFILLPKKLDVYAQEAPHFTSSYSITYTFDNLGTCSVDETIEITNQTVAYYLSSYEISLGTTDLSSLYASNRNGNQLTTSIDTDKKNTSIKITLDEKVVGLGNKNIINLTYKTRSLSSQKGLVWEVMVPKLNDVSNIESYEAVLQIPKSYGLPNDPPDSVEKNYYTYTFSKDRLSKQGAILNFGEYQVFDFDIEYVLLNPNLFSTDQAITFPPSIDNVQEVYFSSISPRPKRLETDAAGNQIAYFRVSGNQELKPSISGKIKIYANINKSSHLENTPIPEDIKPQKYWEAGSDEILKIASQTDTAQDIYNFVVENLTYRATYPGDALDRAGALSALLNKSGVCTEFSDLFTAIARAKGIPTQVLDGFAYSKENEELKPNPESPTVLHTWVRFWEEGSGWHYIDPTWGNTTSGLDYYDKFDTNHVVFAIKGASSTYPYAAGSYLEGNIEIRDTVNIHFAENNIIPESFFTYNSLEQELREEITIRKSSWGKIYAIAGLSATLLFAGSSLIFLRKRRSCRQHLPQDQAQ